MGRKPWEAMTDGNPLDTAAGQDLNLGCDDGRTGNVPNPGLALVPVNKALPHQLGGDKVFVLVPTVVLFMSVLQYRCRIWGGHNQARFLSSSTGSLGHPLVLVPTIPSVHSRSL